MYISYHGGGCCGIKTIGLYGNTSPTTFQPSRHGSEVVTHADSIGASYSKTSDFFHEKAPRESGIDRFDRLLDYLYRRRPGHLVEVVLINHPDHWASQYRWVPILLERGFKEVVTFQNSNSKNLLTVFHLVIQEVGFDEYKNVEKYDLKSDYKPLVRHLKEQVKEKEPQ